jgi:hypothetical protein
MLVEIIAGHHHRWRWRQLQPAPTATTWYTGEDHKHVPRALNQSNVFEKMKRKALAMPVKGLSPLGVAVKVAGV